jgi:hypothetical protein
MDNHDRLLFNTQPRLGVACQSEQCWAWIASMNLTRRTRSGGRFGYLDAEYLGDESPRFPVASPSAPSDSTTLSTHVSWGSRFIMVRHRNVQLVWSRSTSTFIGPISVKVAFGRCRYGSSRLHASDLRLAVLQMLVHFP